MKLRNKKTGEIVIADVTHMVSGVQFDCGQSLAELNEEWEDYEEPEEYWIITDCGGVSRANANSCIFKEIDNFFSSREEAERTVEKLKAWKRLKDKGFRFTGFGSESIGYEIKELSGDFALDLDLLFNGGEK